MDIGHLFFGHKAMKRQFSDETMWHAIGWLKAEITVVIAISYEQEVDTVFQ